MFLIKTLWKFQKLERQSGRFKVYFKHVNQWFPFYKNLGYIKFISSIVTGWLPTFLAFSILLPEHFNSIKESRKNVKNLEMSHRSHLLSVTFNKSVSMFFADLLVDFCNVLLLFCVKRCLQQFLFFRMLSLQLLKISPFTNRLKEL